MKSVRIHDLSFEGGAAGLYELCFNAEGSDVRFSSMTTRLPEWSDVVRHVEGLFGWSPIVDPNWSDEQHAAHWREIAG